MLKAGTGTMRKKILDRMIRVDHAGELGADRIYAGQMAVLGRTSAGPLIKHMWEQEKEHRRTFEDLIPKYRVRPTVMIPVWNVFGFVLGSATALMGTKAAMACTVAVETVITEHYDNQIRELVRIDADKELLDVISKFRDEEMEHHDTGLQEGAEQAPGYTLLSGIVKACCRAAIFISERI